MFVVWTDSCDRIGVSVQLGSNGTDDLGRAGNAGFVDNHYVERFGAAIMLSVVGGAAPVLERLWPELQQCQRQRHDHHHHRSGYWRDHADADRRSTRTSSTLQARQIAAQNVSQTLTNIAQEALTQLDQHSPTIYLDQGTRIIVFVRRDLDFSAFYPDPVKEALQEIKRERAGQKPNLVFVDRALGAGRARGSMTTR